MCVIVESATYARHASHAFIGDTSWAALPHHIICVSTLYGRSLMNYVRIVAYPGRDVSLVNTFSRQVVNLERDDGRVRTVEPNTREKK